MSVTFAVPAEASLPLPPQTPMLAGWTSFDQWLWQLASATTYDSYPPAQRDHDQLRRIMISLSADWSALVLRDGAAFVASRPECEPSELDFFASAEAFFRSIYLDALLLGNVQRLMLWRLADEVAALRDPVEAPAEVRRLQRQFTSFRNVYWWQHMTHHGIANDLAVAYAGQHRLSELVQQMFEELGEYARQVQTAATERVSALLAILTVIGVPVAIPIGILQVLGEERVGWLAVGVASATLVSLWMIFGLRIWRFFR